MDIKEMSQIRTNNTTYRTLYDGGWPIENGDNIRDTICGILIEGFHVWNNHTVTELSMTQHNGAPAVAYKAIMKGKSGYGASEADETMHVKGLLTFHNFTCTARLDGVSDAENTLRTLEYHSYIRVYWDLDNEHLEAAS